MKGGLHKHEINQNIGFVSMRLAGMDGVSLETEKWAKVLRSDGFRCFYFAGELDTPEECSYLMPEAHFTHKDIQNIYINSFGQRIRNRSITEKIKRFTKKIKDHLYVFIEKFDIGLLIPENALTIPLNIPLGIALTELIAETGIPTIAHHHDFFWERQRFLTNAVWDYLNMAFPPHLGPIKHVVINSSADNQLSLRTGISGTMIPNVMDFEHPPEPPDEYASDVREALRVADDEFLILQPTRVVKRKGIEHAIELVHRLDMKAKLVISHASGDEGYDYEQRVRDYSKLMNVDTVFVSDIINEHRGRTPDGRKVYTLYDIYPHADLVTYPSTFEGFGNAFLEAIYFSKPIVVNTYSIYTTDIQPKGFKTIEMDGHVSNETVMLAKRALIDRGYREDTVRHNYEVAKRYFSFTVLQRKLRTLIADYRVS